MSKKELPKGFKCTTCNKEHIFPAYVYAHWDDLLIHTCDECGAKHSVMCGEVEVISEGVKQIVKE